MSLLSRGTVNITAVTNLRKKKKIGLIILNLLCLSRFKTRALKFFLASLILKNGCLLQINTVNMNGIVTDPTIMQIEAILAIFLAFVIGSGSA